MTPYITSRNHSKWNMTMFIQETLAYVAMLSKGRQHWFQPAAQDNIADFTLAVILRHGHYMKWPVIIYCQIHATETFTILVTFVQ